MLPFFDDYFQAKKYVLILSRDIDDQRILQSDWKADKMGHTPNQKQHSHMLPFFYRYSPR